VFYTQHRVGTPADDLSQMQAIIDSIQIDP
jgi:hypothetical protein